MSEKNIQNRNLARLGVIFSNYALIGTIISCLFFISSILVVLYYLVLVFILIFTFFTILADPNFKKYFNQDAFLPNLINLLMPYVPYFIGASSVLAILGIVFTSFDKGYKKANNKKVVSIVCLIINVIALLIYFAAPQLLQMGGG